MPERCHGLIVLKMGAEQYLHDGCAGESVLDFTTETGTFRHDIDDTVLDSIEWKIWMEELSLGSMVGPLS